MPKISVIIATYNMADYLPCAIDSALAQGYPDTEVVILDDGSTDNTRAVVEDYGDSVRYHWQPNQGVALAYNHLLELARGDYIHHLDADDTLAPGALRRLATLLDENPSVGLAYGAAEVRDSDGRVYGRRTAPDHFSRLRVVPSPTAFKALLRGCHITTSTVMLRRSVLDHVAPFQPDAVPGEDWDMWLRTAAAFDFAYCPDTIAQYRVHGTSITSAYTVDRVLDSHLFTLQRLYADPDFRYRETEPYAYACLDRTLALVAARGRHRRRFVSHLRRALRRHPNLARERETLGVLCEGLKSLVPAPFIGVGRSVRQRLTARGNA